MPLIPNLSLYLIQKFDRLALWGNLTILELHFAETQVLGDFNYFLLCEKIFWYIIIKILRPCENTEMEGRNYDQKDRFAYKRR